MTGVEILLSVSALLALPVIASRWPLEPASLTRAAIWSVVLSGVIVLSTLAICAAALVGTLGPSPTDAGHGVSARHLLPAPFMGWISLTVIAVVLTSGAWSLINTGRCRRQLREQLSYAEVTHIDDVAVVSVPTDNFVATTVPGPNGCVHRVTRSDS